MLEKDMEVVFIHQKVVDRPEEYIRIQGLAPSQRIFSGAWR